MATVPRHKRNNPDQLLMSELVDLKSRVSALEESNRWIVDSLKSLDRKVWGVLAGVMVLILLTIAALLV